MNGKIQKPVLLCILDGWGLKNGGPGDTLSIAKTPNFDRLWANCPHTTLKASGDEVGLPAGLMGNSEVGHLNIGGGRIVYQDLSRISKAIKDGEFFANPELLANMQAAKNKGGKLHLMGLLSDGGVHSTFGHLQALLKMAKDNGLTQVYVHCFTDGRDVSPRSGVGYIKALQDYIEEIRFGKIATVMGRFYAMDRDKRWERLEKAWRCLVLGEGAKTSNPVLAVDESYARGITDEFIEPMIITDEDGNWQGNIEDKDSIIFYNFRADRAREITWAFIDPQFRGFKRPVYPKVEYCCMTRYDETLAVPVAFVKQHLENTLGEYLAKCGKKQLRIAETEKYAHVTFFFNGSVEQANSGEDRVLIDSPKVKTYDLQPEMSARGVTDTVVEKIAGGVYDAIILNFANPDMVGHTGVLAAAIKAVEFVDFCLGRVVAAVEAAGGAMIITADHGNVEHMMDEAGNPVTSHTASQVPCIVIADQVSVLESGGALCDLAPTLLSLMGLPKPAEITGQSLIRV